MRVDNLIKLDVHFSLQEFDSIFIIRSWSSYLDVPINNIRVWIWMMTDWDEKLRSRCRCRQTVLFLCFYRRSWSYGRGSIDVNSAPYRSRRKNKNLCPRSSCLCLHIHIFDAVLLAALKWNREQRILDFRPQVASVFSCKHGTRRRINKSRKFNLIWILCLIRAEFQ